MELRYKRCTDGIAEHRSLIFSLDSNTMRLESAYQKDSYIERCIHSSKGQPGSFTD